MNVWISESLRKYHWWDVRVCVCVWNAHYITHSVRSAAPLRLCLNESSTSASVWEERGVCVRDWSLVCRAQQTHRDTATSWLVIATTCEYMFELCMWVCVIVPGLIWDEGNIELCIWFDVKQQILLTSALHSVLCDHMSVMSNKWRRAFVTAHRSCYSTRYLWGKTPF